MPKITREPMTGLAHCSMQTDEHGDLSFDTSGVPNGEGHCEGYRQVEVAAIREVVIWTFGDYTNGSNDPMDASARRQRLATPPSGSSGRISPSGPARSAVSTAS
jgi:hypothetical protein